MNKARNPKVQFNYKVVEKLQQIDFGKATNIKCDKRFFRIPGLAPFPDVLKLVNPVNRVFLLTGNDKDSFRSSLPQLILQFIHVGINLPLVKGLLDDKDYGEVCPVINAHS